MKRITLILGLPGSGKTHYANLICEMSADCLLIDDISIDHEAKIALGQSRSELIITDPAICRHGPETARRLLNAWFGACAINFIAFENDVERCWANIERRADDRNISKSSLIELSNNYRPEDWGTPYPVWSPIIDFREPAGQ